MKLRGSVTSIPMVLTSFEQHMVATHAWGTEVTSGRSSRRVAGGRPWWKWFGIACLLFVVGLGRSGGGLGPSSVCEPLQGLLVAGTLVALLAAALLFVVAVVASTLRAAELYARPASSEAHAAASEPGETLGQEGPSSGILGLLRARGAGLLGGVATIGLAVAVLFAPSGCTPYHFCTQADRPVAPESLSDGLRFAGELPEPRQQGRRDGNDTVYTAIFDAVGPWRMSWTTSADQLRLDVFANDAVQTGTYFPGIGSGGHLHSVIGGPEGSARVDHTGSFCVRVEIIDRKHYAARATYYSLRSSERRGPEPVPPRQSWTLTIRQ